jgi:DNA-binding CsgD family transcriptional regulator
LGTNVEAFIDSTRRIARPAHRGEKPVQLTLQEVECLRWCKEGKTNWEIGEILDISEKTVEFHLSKGMRKLGAGNRITAVIAAIKCGLISL